MAVSTVIVGLGEALFDLLPSGRVLGGAPLNVVCHAHQLLQAKGGQGIVASRVGADLLGDELLAAVVSHGMTADYIQRDPSHATGTVKVELSEGQPKFDIVPDVAWDYLELTPAWQTLAEQASAVCFGSLAQRSAESRDSIQRFLDAAKQAIRLFDVNLRQDYFDRDVLAEGCQRATMVKLNEDELPVVAGLLGLPDGAPVYRLAQLRAVYELDAVVYTRGRRGTMLVVRDKVIAPQAVSYPAAANADAVGAGDACTAGILVGRIRGLSTIQIADLANHLGAYVASQPGATPKLPPEIIDLAC